MALHKGRPSKSGQIQIIKTIRPYFEKSYTASFTSGKTGYDIKTVCRYFNQWSEEILQSEKDDFIQRQRKGKELAIVACDNIIFELYGLIAEINEEIKSLRKTGKENPKHLIKMKFLILREIFSVTQNKFSITMTPSIDVSLKEIVERYSN